jgi:RNA polymerase sigma-70 factor, ECF subfamily
MHRSDPELIRLIQEHDTSAFETFFARYRSPIHRLVMGIVREAAAGEDLVQEVFLRVWLRAEQWDGHGAVKSWLYRIATNLALNHLRSERRHPQQPLEQPSRREGEAEEFTVPGWLIEAAASEPSTVVEMADQMRRLGQLVEALPEDKRTVFQLVYEAELDLRSVADQLGVPEGTVKSRLYYSKKYLARQWREEER